MKEKHKKKSILQKEIAIGGVTLVQKALFAKHLSVMLRAGLTLVEALTIATDSSQGKMKKVLGKITKAVESGVSFSAALMRHEKYFSGLFLGAVRAGENSGTLDENLEHLAAQLEKEKELAEKIKGAMFYPVIVLIAAFFLGIALAFLVLPKIIPLFEGIGVDLPWTTQMLIQFSHFIEAHGGPFFVVLITAFFGLIWLFQQKFMRPFAHGIVLRAPIVKRISRNANIARFARTLGTLLKSGMVVDEALAISRDSVHNYYYQRAIGIIAQRIAHGDTLSSNLSAFGDLFPLMITRMVMVGEESGELEDTLLYLADFYETEVDTATKSLSSVIEPLLLLFIGGFVAFLALSIITPIYNITGNIGRQ